MPKDESKLNIRIKTETVPAGHAETVRTYPYVRLLYIHTVLYECTCSYGTAIRQIHSFFHFVYGLRPFLFFAASASSAASATVSATASAASAASTASATASAAVEAALADAAAAAEAAATVTAAAAVAASDAAAAIEK